MDIESANTTDAESGKRLRDSLRDKMRHPYITGQGLEASGGSEQTVGGEDAPAEPADDPGPSGRSKS
jgi:hypothetical protein